jgi:hypothetical protein
MRSVLRVLLASLVLSAVSSLASAQAGWTTEKRPDLGLEFPVPKAWEGLPAQPDEQWVVLIYQEKVDPKKPKRAQRPELSVVWIEHQVAQASSADAADEEEASERRTKARAAEPITSLESWARQQMKGWTLGKAQGEPKQVKDWTGQEYALLPGKGAIAGLDGWAYEWRGPTRTLAFVATCPKEDWEANVALWRKMASDATVSDPEDRDAVKLERMYARSKLLDPAYRIEVRKKLIRGWRAEDAEHYILATNSPDKPLIKRVLSDLPIIRKEYEKLFPPAAPITRVSTVRVCKTRDEYLQYGGGDRTAGYWNASSEELVLYDNAADAKALKRADDLDTFIVLYHEAFHQYIHYSAGELPPHTWFNEGYGDYFSGAVIVNGKLKEIGVNPWRCDTIKEAVSLDKHIPWKEIIKYEQREYYDPTKVYICYAQGWAMVYFLNKSKDVAKNPAWKKILPTYFDTLKSAYKEELDKLPEEARKPGTRGAAEAGYRARTRANEAAFAGVDFDQIETAWKLFTLDLVSPPRETKK